MKLIPAIDLQDGKCVRLLQGDFQRSTHYSDDPLLMARTFAAMDIDNLHVVDLDGARLGQQYNHAIIARIANELDIGIQLGGGIRHRETIARWLAAGVSRCVIGSAAITDPESVTSWLSDFGPERIVLALDVTLDDDQQPWITTHGWTRNSEASLWHCIESYRDVGLQHLLCTDVSRDGAMAGPNIELYEQILTRFPGIALQASGGVRNIGDLVELRALGVPAAITGRALLDGKITPAEVAAFRQNA